MNVSQQLAEETREIVSTDAEAAEPMTAVIYVRTTPSRKAKLQLIVDAYNAVTETSQNSLFNSLLDKLFESYDAAVAAREKALEDSR